MDAPQYRANAGLQGGLPESAQRSSASVTPYRYHAARVTKVLALADSLRRAH